jgi:MFS family permease
VPACSISCLHRALTGEISEDVVCTVHGGFDDVDQDVDNPTRQAFVVDMVGPADIRNTVSLNSANFQSARMIGPAVAGVLITALGSGWAFLFNGLSFLAPLAGLLLMRTSELHVVERAPRGKGQLREGLRYVAGRPELSGRSSSWASSAPSPSTSRSGSPPSTTTSSTAMPACTASSTP